MSERAPGFEEYIPSRLEWLTVMLNSLVQYINAANQSVQYVYIPENDGKTILLLIKHKDNLDPENLKMFEDNARNLAMNFAKSYKWDSWINIQTQFDPIPKSSG